MVKIPERGDPTLLAIDRIIEENDLKNRWKKKSIGFSEIGKVCSRQVFYAYNNYPSIPMEAFVIKCAQNGHSDELIMENRLRLLPEIELHTKDPETGKQYRFSDLDGKYVGRPDGFILGLIEAPTTWHLWEHKSKEEKYFKELVKLKAEDEKTALQKWDPEYYAQAVSLMHYSELTRHYLTVGLPGLRRVISVRTNANPEFANALKIKAQRLLGAKEPPEKIGGPDFYKCKMCQYRDTCHGTP